MAEISVDRGKVGVERLQVTFAQPGGKLFRTDSAFAELLQTRVKDSPRQASAARPDERSTGSQPETSDISSSRADREPRKAEEAEDESENEEEAEAVRAEPSSRTSGDDSEASDQAVSMDAKQRGEDSESLREALDAAPVDRDELPATEEGSRPPTAAHAVEDSTRLASHGESGLRAEPSPSRDSEPAMAVETKGDGVKGPATTEVGVASETAAMGSSTVRQAVGSAKDSADWRKLKGDGSDRPPTDRNDPVVEEKHPDAQVKEDAGKKAEAPSAPVLDATGDSVSQLGRNERGTTEESRTAERARGRGKRQVQKGDVKNEDGGDRFQPARVMQGTPLGPADKPAAAQNVAPVLGDIGASPAAPGAANAAPAVAATESNAARSDPVMAGTGNTKTDSGPTGYESQATPPGRNGEGSRTNIDAADRARFVQRVSQAFRAANERGGHVRLRLHPPELGSLRVELKITDGVMSARMEAESAAARDLLAEHLPLLRQRLADHGIRVERFELDLMGQGGQDASQQAFQPPSDGQGRRHHEMGTSRRRAQAVEPPGRADGTAVGVRTANGIDVLI